MPHKMPQGPLNVPRRNISICRVLATATPAVAAEPPIAPAVTLAPTALPATGTNVAFDTTFVELRSAL